MYFVYILRSIKNGLTYVGVTEKSPAQRLYQHNTGSTEWTRSNKPFALIYYESYYCKADALLREKFLKSGIGNKLVALIKNNFDAQFRPQGDCPVGRVRASH